MKQLIACFLLLLLAAPAWGSVKGDIPLGDLTSSNIIERIQAQINVNQLWEKLKIKDEKIDKRIARSYDVTPNVSFGYSCDKDTQKIVMLYFFIDMDASLPKKQSTYIYLNDIWEAIQVAVGLFTSPNGRKNLKESQEKIFGFLGPGNKNIQKRWQKMHFKKQGITLSAQIMDDGVYALIIDSCTKK